MAEDQANGFFMPVAKQLEMACNMISGDEKLQQGFHAVGFSQGGLFLRALAQTCSSAKVLNLVSVGGPQQVRSSALVFTLPCPALPCLNPSCVFARHRFMRNPSQPICSPHCPQNPVCYSI